MKTTITITLPNGTTVEVEQDRLNALVSAAKNRVFSDEDLLILGKYKKMWVKRIEEFCKEYAHLFPWQKHKLPYAIHTGVERFMTTLVYVDSNGRVFQSLAAVSNYYGVDVEYLWERYHDRIIIPEFNSTTRCFHHLCFEDAEGNKVSMIREYRSSICEDHGVKEWETASPSIRYAQHIHGILRFATLVMHAIKHLDDGHPRYDYAERQYSLTSDYEAFEANRR